MNNRKLNRQAVDIAGNLTEQFCRMFSKSRIFLFLFILTGITSGLAQNSGSRKALQLTVQLRGVYDAKVSVSAYGNGKYQAPFSEIPDVKEKVQISIPEEHLPGQFLLRMDYRKKAEDQPYPAEFVFFMNKHDLALKLNPLNLRPDSIDFGNDDENPVYYGFLKGNEERRQQLVLLEQVLGGYDSPGSQFYKIAKEEFEKRRVGYNIWITLQESQHKDLFVSRLFAFLKVIPLRWDVPAEEQLKDQARHYFDEINLGDELLVKTQAFSDFLNGYVAMFGRHVRNETERDSMFTRAGRMACSRAALGHPKVYGWVVDYFYSGYETYGITSGMKMLEKHIQNPNCLTSKKQEIVRRLEGMEKLVEGAVAPSFEAELANGMQVRFNGISKDKSYGLLIFYESDCSYCKELIQGMKTWYGKPENSAWFDVITVAVDDDQEKWKKYNLQQNYKWTDVWAPGGVNSKVSRDYYILSTPVMYIVDKQMKVMAMPKNVEQIEKFLNQ